MTKPPIFIELCAGTAALSLRLQGGRGAKPPVSRMGAKTGYADAILAVLGLYPGQGAESYLWCEPDDGVRGLLMAYPQPQVLRQAAAILRGWKDEEPRALWERLRAELKAGASVEGAQGVAKLCMVIGSSFGGSEGRFSGWFNPESDAAVARLGAGYIARLVAENGRDAKGRPLAKAAGHPDVMAPRLEALAERTYPPTFIARDGRAVTPEEVARIILSGVWSYKQMEPESGFVGPGDRFQDTSPQAVSSAVARMAAASWPPVTIVADGRVVTPEDVARLAYVAVRTFPHTHASGEERDNFLPQVALDGKTIRYPADHPAGRFDWQSRIVWPPVTLTADARTLTPPRLPDGVIAYMDPPYVATTPYKHDLSREEVVRMARLWADAGATVCISEAEAIPELMADGWHAVEISATRKGQKRTFSKQQAEWLTLSRAPSFVPRVSEVFIEAPIVEVVKPVRVKAAPIVVEPQEPQGDRQVDLFGGDR